MYAVSDAGGLWQVFGYGDGDRSISSSFIGTVTDDGGNPISFAALTPAPANVELGRYAGLMFGADLSGNLYAFDTTATLQPIFLDSQTTISTGLASITGLAFGQLEQNPWYVTVPNDPINEREGDAGHGIVTPVTETREAGDGDSSLHFGNGEGNSFDTPGGSHGTIFSNPFSLADYAPEDEPVIYFNYFIDSDNSDGNDMTDAIRVYIADESHANARGRWYLLATNNSTGEFDDLDTGDDIDLGLDTIDIADEDLPIAELFDGAGWRQARVSLRDFAGSTGLRLRFDFATQGDIGLGSVNYGGPAAFGNEGEELRAVDASNIADGHVFVIDSEQFEFDMGFTLATPQGVDVRDGETFVIEDVMSGDIQTYEFDKDGSVAGTNLAVPIFDSQSAASVATSLQTALLDNGAPVVPYRLENRVNLFGDVNVTQPVLGNNEPYGEPRWRQRRHRGNPSTHPFGNERQPGQASDDPADCRRVCRWQRGRHQTLQRCHQDHRAHGRGGWSTKRFSVPRYRAWQSGTVWGQWRVRTRRAGTAGRKQPVRRNLHR